MKSSTNDTKLLILSTARRIIASKGYAAVGLSEILHTAKVPKGSFYHYFASKDQFGVELLRQYFDEYLQRLDRLLSVPQKTALQKLESYFDAWVTTQSSGDNEQMCLAVKLGGEVSDLSELMRDAMRQGTQRIIERIACSIQEGVADGSIHALADAVAAAEILYQTWVGASLLEKIHRNGDFFARTRTWTQRFLQR